MGLVVFTGYPSSGKSTAAKKLAEILQTKHGKAVHIISENEYVICKDQVFTDAKKEKELRATLKSETQRRISEGGVVILDAGNYIKGFRYELYCAAKESKTRQCTIYCALSPEMAWDLNENSAMPYSRSTFDALVTRYEEPDSRNRWDSPLFTLLKGSSLPEKEIYNALFLAKVPRPNQSTQMVPVSRPDLLYDIDKATQNIVMLLLEAQKFGTPMEMVDIPECTEHVTCSQKVSAADLRRLRRQFVSYYKTQVADESHSAGSLFVQYLTKNLS